MKKENLYLVFNSLTNALVPLLYWPSLTQVLSSKELDDLSFALVLFGFSNVFIDLATNTITNNKFSNLTNLDLKKSVLGIVIILKSLIALFYAIIMFFLVNHSMLVVELIILGLFIHSNNNLWYFISARKMSLYFITNLAVKMTVYALLVFTGINADVLYGLSVLVSELMLSLLFLVIAKYSFIGIKKKVLRIVLNDGVSQVLTSLGVSQYRNLPFLLIPYFVKTDGYFSSLFIIEKLARAPSMILVPLNIKIVANLKKGNGSYFELIGMGWPVLTASFLASGFLCFSSEILMTYFNVENIYKSVFNVLAFLPLLSGLVSVLGQNRYIVLNNYGLFVRTILITGFASLMLIILMLIINPEKTHVAIITAESLVGASVIAMSILWKKK